MEGLAMGSAERLVDESTELAAAVEARTVPEAFQRTVSAHADRIAFREIGGGSSLTWSKAGQRVRDLAAGLASIGLAKGDRLAILLPNTIECHLVDYAAAHLGAVPFTIFNSSAPEQVAHQVGTAGATVMVTSNRFLPKVEEALAQLPQPINHLVVVDAVEGLTLEAIEQLGAADTPFDLDNCSRSIEEGDLATLIFTSGTTGLPKAVKWSHRAVMSQLRALDQAVPLSREAILSFLPLAHAGGKTNALYGALVHGATVTACPDIAQFGTGLVDARPDTLFSTPRLFEKLQVAIETLIRAASSEEAEYHEATIALGVEIIKAGDFATADGAGISQDDLARHAEGVAALKPILSTLGLDRIRAAFVGGAPSAPELVYFFRAIGVPLLEAYGATETGQNIFNRVDRFKTGTAGLAVPGVELAVAPDGELLARSPMNMDGYLDLPGETAATIDEQGWVHTGDVVEMDADGFVKVVDRKKEIIINAAGKNMSPALIESTIKAQSSLIGQVVAIGDGKRYVTALITLEAEALPRLSAARGIPAEPLMDVVAAPQVVAEVERAVAQGNARLNSNEQIKKFTLLPEIWVPDSDQLTPTGKLKRRAIAARYATEIDAMYNN
jgi:long-chain acyl-CoA synthetase